MKKNVTDQELIKMGLKSDKPDIRALAIKLDKEVKKNKGLTALARAIFSAEVGK
ncbi:hypothetical protein [Candidatus Macondimonas diazotrophica]|jgi:hypothetical protein|uniref:hypothetical protein n=1 Tax=Candidatus Macondimonas diazotrophica TaxID=2305248 RepID=UPI0014323B56|nr:hypothetical protein [Candidatus Macondimonas diazotrophica]